MHRSLFLIAHVLITLSLTACGARPSPRPIATEPGATRPLSDAPRAIVWPSPERAVPANTAWIVLGFNVPVAAEDLQKLGLKDGDVRVEPRWIMTAADPYVRGAILWGPFQDPRCAQSDEATLCAGHEYAIDGPAGVRNEEGTAARILATLRIGPPALKGPEWTGVGGVRASDTAVEITRTVDAPCVLRGPELPLMPGEPTAIFDMSTGKALITGLAPQTLYTWQIECVDAAGQSTPPWPITFATEPSRRTLISELVVDPQHDWNDSQAENGAPFDAAAALSDRASSTDEWVEIENAGAAPIDLAGYVVMTVDTSPASVRIGDAFTGKTPQGFTANGTTRLLPGERLVVRASPSSENAANDARFELRDELGMLRDAVSLGKSGLPNGDAHGPSDEAVAACMNGESRTWRKVRATPGAANACP
ncbi:MAG: hypothetical protein IT381_27040 [Deltaproteobacteria bacterium]|nr:hypothetical protein [Deltaproteobacteria bacterium]